MLNDRVVCADWPSANEMSAAWCVGTSTGNSVPARGPEPITRVSRDFDATACTREAEPNAWSRVVT